MNVTSCNNININILVILKIIYSLNKALSHNTRVSGIKTTSYTGSLAVSAKKKEPFRLSDKMN